MVVKGGERGEDGFFLTTKRGSESERVRRPDGFCRV